MKPESLQIKIKVSDTYKKFFGNKFVLPEYKTLGSSGLDLYFIEDLGTSFFAGKADVPNMTGLSSGEIKICGTGIYISIPKGYEAQIRSRSGLAAKDGIFVLNSPGSIDSDFRGELKVILANFSKQPWLLRVGDRIAQLVFAKVERIHWDLTEELDNTDRGIKGCGSTGV